MAEPLKARFDRAEIEALAAAFERVDGSFPVAVFVDGTLDAFPALELKQRVGLAADNLAGVLPAPYPEALEVVLAVAGQDGIDGFVAWPLCTFVERHGLEHPRLSLDAMATLTPRWTCEFALRPFLEHHFELTRSYLKRWVRHPDEAVRRLASEGTRPLLPWGQRVAALTGDPTIGIETVTALRHDSSETVRRSVANHLNDVAKTQPDLVVELLSGWMAESPRASSSMVHHALRTLVKQGHPGALQLLGITTEPHVVVHRFTCEPEVVTLGDMIELTASLGSSSESDQKIVIDFRIHHVTASGGSSPKVFKWTVQDIGPGEVVQISKRRRIQTAATRRYHAGEHRIELLVSGRAVASAGFMVQHGSDDVG